MVFYFSIAGIVLLLTYYKVASAFIITDPTIRSLDYTPSIGRGYSQTSETFFSTCLRKQGDIIPAFDYDFNVMFMTSTDEANIVLPSAFGDALSFVDIVSQVTFETGDVTTRFMNIVALLKVDRYYESLQKIPELLPQATTMLDRGDILGFLQVCGPRYISSLRKRSELLTVFHTQIATDAEPTEEFVAQFYRNLGGSEDVDTRDANFDSYFQSTTVQIKGYGLRRVEGDHPGTLVPQGLRDFSRVLSYGFESVRHNDAGLVYSAVVTSWTTHFDFQAAVGLDAILEYEVCYDSNQNQIPCGGTPEPASTEVYTHSLSMLRMIFVMNAEFLLNLDRIVQKKMSTLYRLSRCTESLRRFNNCNSRKLLRHSNYDMVDREHGRTPQDILTQLEAMRPDLPPQRRSMIGRKQQDIMNYVTHFYAPCIDRLTAEDLGLPSGRMFSTPFINIPECMDTTCQLDISVYDTDIGQCVSFIPGATYDLVQCNRHSRPTDGAVHYNTSPAYSSLEGCETRCAGLGFAYFSRNNNNCGCHNAIGHRDAEYFPCENWCYGDRSNYPYADHPYPWQSCTFEIKQRTALRQCNSHARPTDGDMDFDTSEEYSTHEGCRSRCSHLGYSFFSRNDNNCGCHNDIGHPDAEIIPCGQYCYGDRDDFPRTDHSYPHVFCTSAILPSSYETNAVDHVLDEFCMPNIFRERPFTNCVLILLPGQYLKPGEYVCNDRANPTQMYGLNARGEVVRMGHVDGTGQVAPNEVFDGDLPTNPYLMLVSDQTVSVYDEATNPPPDGYGCNSNWDQSAGVQISNNDAEEDCGDDCNIFISWSNGQICIRFEDGHCLVNLAMTGQSRDADGRAEEGGGEPQRRRVFPGEHRGVAMVSGAQGERGGADEALPDVEAEDFALAGGDDDAEEVPLEQWSNLLSF